MSFLIMQKQSFFITKKGNIAYIWPLNSAKVKAPQWHWSNIIECYLIKKKSENNKQMNKKASQNSMKTKSKNKRRERSKQKRQEK